MSASPAANSIASIAPAEIAIAPPVNTKKAESGLIGN
jgi:hypothetical protein